MKDLKALHDRYDKYLDPEYMENMVYSDWYNLKHVDDENEMEFSTDFSDVQEDMMYKRFKLI